MIVRVHSRGVKIAVPVSASAVLIAAKAAMRTEGIDLPVRQIMHEILRAKRLHPDWVLAEVESAEGDHIVIKP